MNKKTYNYEPSKSWSGGTGPNCESFNGSKKDFNAYLKVWDELNTAIERITGLKVTAWDPDIILTDDKNGKWTTVQLSPWFVKILIDKYEAMELKLLNAQPNDRYDPIEIKSFNTELNS